MRPSYRKDFYTFELKIRRREITDSYDIAYHILRLFRKSLRPLQTSDEVVTVFRDLTLRLKSHFPHNLMITNVCNILNARLNDETKNQEALKPKAGPQLQPQSSREFRGKKKPNKVIWNTHSNLNKNDCDFMDSTPNFLPRSHSKSIIDMLVSAEPAKEPDAENSDQGQLKARMIEVLDLLDANLGNSYKSIAKFSSNFLFSHDIILTLGHSQSILNFLTEPHINMTVFVTERAPEYDGIKMAAELRRNHLNVVVIPDCAVFAILPKVSKIIVPVFTVLENGGIVSYSLAHSVALAAKHYSTPFIALYWSMKLKDKMPLPGKVFTTLHQPSQIMVKGDPTSSNVVALNIEGDYIPPELITLLINEDGAHCPADVYNIVQQMYCEEE